MKRLCFVIVGFCVLLTAWSDVNAHPFHSSLAEVEWNAKTNSLEVALRVQPSDLETALRRQTKRQIVLEETKNVAALIRDYLRQTFVVKTPDGKLVDLTWVGHEVSVKHAWLYFEVALPAGPGEIEITHAMLFEMLPDQLNIVNLRVGKRKLTLHFSHSESTRKVQLP